LCDLASEGGLSAVLIAAADPAIDPRPPVYGASAKKCSCL
jgi:hypothetical protein